MVCGYTTKYLDDPCLATNLFSNLTLTDRWGKDWLVSFNTSKTKLVCFIIIKQTPNLLQF